MSARTWRLKISLSPLSGLGASQGHLYPGLRGGFQPPLAAGLDYAGLSGQAFDAVPLSVTFDCTQVK